MKAGERDCFILPPAFILLMSSELLHFPSLISHQQLLSLIHISVTVSITSLPSPWRHSRWLGWRLRTCPKRLILRHLCSRSTNPCNSSFIKASYCPLVKNLRDVRGPDSNRPSPARKAILWFTAKIMSKLGGLLILGFLRVRKLLLPL